MEPTTALLGILAAGATAAIKDVAGQSVKDLYSLLKTAIGKLIEDPETIEKLEKDQRIRALRTP